MPVLYWPSGKLNLQQKRHRSEWAVSWYYYFHQKLFAFIDILLVVGLATIFSIAGFVVYQQTLDRRQADQEISNLNLIIGAVKKTFNNDGYAKVNTGLLNQSHVFPRSMNADSYRATQEITHSEGGKVVVVPYGKHHQYFSIVYNHVSSNLCLRLVQNSTLNTTQIKVGGVLVKDFENTNIDPALMVGQCNAAQHTEIQFINK